MRKIKLDQLTRPTKGKTISSIDVQAVNEIILRFSDGSFITLETVSIYLSNNLYGFEAHKSSPR